MVEQRLDKPLVASSNLASGTKFVVLAKERHIDLGFETEVNVKQERVRFPADRKIRS